MEVGVVPIGLSFKSIWAPLGTVVTSTVNNIGSMGLDCFFIIVVGVGILPCLWTAGVVLNT